MSTISLPREIVQNGFNFLQINELLVAAEVNHEWNQEVNYRIKEHAVAAIHNVEIFLQTCLSRASFADYRTQYPLNACHQDSQRFANCRHLRDTQPIAEKIRKQMVHFLLNTLISQEKRLAARQYVRPLLNGRRIAYGIPYLRGVARELNNKYSTVFNYGFEKIFFLVDIKLHILIKDQIGTSAPTEMCNVFRRLAKNRCMHKALKIEQSMPLFRDNPNNWARGRAEMGVGLVQRGDYNKALQFMNITILKKPSLAAQIENIFFERAVYQLIEDDQYDIGREFIAHIRDPILANSLTKAIEAAQAAASDDDAPPAPKRQKR